MSLLPQSFPLTSEASKFKPLKCPLRILRLIMCAKKYNNRTEHCGAHFRSSLAYTPGHNACRCTELRSTCGCSRCRSMRSERFCNRRSSPGCPSRSLPLSLPYPSRAHTDTETTQVHRYVHRAQRYEWVLTYSKYAPTEFAITSSTMRCLYLLSALQATHHERYCSSDRDGICVHVIPQRIFDCRSHLSS